MYKGLTFHIWIFFSEVIYLLKVKADLRPSNVRQVFVGIRW